MTIVSFADFKRYIRTEAVGGSDDLAMKAAHLAAEQGVADYCNRQIALVGAESARTFRASNLSLQMIDDCVSVTSVELGGTTLAATDWEAEHTEPGMPIVCLRRLFGRWTQDSGESALVVVAPWGWAAFPEPIRTSVFLLGKEIADGRDGDVKERSIVARLLGPYRLLNV